MTTKLAKIMEARAVDVMDKDLVAMGYSKEYIKEAKAELAPEELEAITTPARNVRLSRDIAKKERELHGDTIIARTLEGSADAIEARYVKKVSLTPEQSKWFKDKGKTEVKEEAPKLSLSLHKKDYVSKDLLAFKGNLGEIKRHFKPRKSYVSKRIYKSIKPGLSKL